MMSSPVYADLLRPAHRRTALVFDAALVAGFSLVIALCSQVAIPLPFTPVPVTLQTFAVLLTGCILGSGRGALSVVLYVAEGSIGLPFFSGGTSGIAHLFGPTGGYLLGFALCALVVGLFAERGLAMKWPGRLLTLVMGNVVIYVPGLLWLGAFVGMNRAVTLGFIPFIAGDALKLAAGWGLLSAAAMSTARLRSRST
jgi:biotin transport system substrate-specific component